MTLIEEIFFGEAKVAPVAPNPAPTAPPAPPTAPLPPTQSPVPTIVAWADAIRIREGGRPNDPNTLNKNPGNMRCSTLTRSFKGFSHCSPNNFCVFDTDQDGFNALVSFLTMACEGQLLPYQPTMSILSFTKKYAQPPDNQYAIAVAKAMGLSVNDPISKALS